MPDVTRLLNQCAKGESAAAHELLPLIYDELRRLAAAKLASEKPGQTLQATALVHEAYVRLVDSATPQRWEHRGHFYAAAAEAMRRILVETARRKRAGKHGGALRRIALDEALLVTQTADGTKADQVLAINDALTALESEEPRKALLVKLRYFSGMTLDEAAAFLGISPATAKRDWTYARAWLYDRIRRGDE